MNRLELIARLTDTYWLTVALDGTVEDEKIKLLVDMCYESTK